MSFNNKFKSTTIYGILRNENLVDASNNLITKADVYFAESVEIGYALTSKYITSEEIVATNFLACDGEITGHVLRSTTNIYGNTLNCSNVNCNTINGGTINLETINLETINLETVKTTVSSSFSGSVVFSQPFNGNSYKKIVIYCNNLIGNSSFTFNTAFSYIPIIIGNSSLVSSLSTTDITISTSVSTSTFIILEGF